MPKSVVDSLEANRDLGLHTLVYLDIKVDDRHWEEVDGDVHDRQSGRHYAAELFAEHLGTAWPGRQSRPISGR